MLNLKGIDSFFCEEKAKCVRILPGKPSRITLGTTDLEVDPIIVLSIHVNILIMFLFTCSCLCCIVYKLV